MPESAGGSRSAKSTRSNRIYLSRPQKTALARACRMTSPSRSLPEIEAIVASFLLFRACFNKPSQTMRSKSGQVWKPKLLRTIPEQYLKPANKLQ